MDSNKVDVLRFTLQMSLQDIFKMFLGRYSKTERI